METEIIKRVTGLGIIEMFDKGDIALDTKKAPDIDGHRLILSAVGPFREYVEWNCREITRDDLEDGAWDCGEEVYKEKDEFGDFVWSRARSVLRFHADVETRLCGVEMEVSILDKFAVFGLSLHASVLGNGRVLLTLTNPTSHAVPVYSLYGIGTASFYESCYE